MPPTPTLADQVSRLYDLVAGYHATNLLEVGRELGVWEALTRHPGLASAELADRLLAASEGETVLAFFARAADEVRDRLTAAGVAVEDTPDGPTWSLKDA
jgi:cysteinyl-tRNA synthetase